MFSFGRGRCGFVTVDPLMDSRSLFAGLGGLVSALHPQTKQPPTKTMCSTRAFELLVSFSPAYLASTCRKRSGPIVAPIRTARQSHVLYPKHRQGDPFSFLQSQPDPLFRTPVPA